MNTNALMDLVAAYVRNLYATAPAETQLPYHNLGHVEGVVQAAVQISDHYQLEEEDYTAVYVAAWFHDVGYLTGAAEQHEMRGAALAEKWLREQNAAESLIMKVKGCIMATRLPQSPNTLIEQIICDADLFHMGTERFKETNKQVRKEVEARLGCALPDDKWYAGNIEMLQRQQYHTDYARTLLQQGKEENIKKLREKLDKKEHKAMETNSEIKGKEKDKEHKKKDKGMKPERGVETMFRTTSTNHLRLSEMADNKAHIMITVNSIIVSVLVSLLFRKLEDNTNLIIPAILTMATSLISIVFAILVTRPNVTQGTFTKEDITSKRANLLFFGNFYRMSLDDYEWGINEMMKDSEFLYGSMTRDIYNLGVVLGRKYKLLRIAYNVFMFGFVISSLSFVLAIIIR
ncbi:Pycsar system effector family protein [Taibaiella soli]|uniref:Phosphohydrolase n=1 Tax=Taibaiella soli TaxID=1649169 RepID=A0A2W2BJU4_9BACT|nr:Pycsar system effector family protein [Taibaiella soli]PZF73716.1 phosphohydrolase [Taibaiella soli]